MHTHSEIVYIYTELSVYPLFCSVYTLFQSAYNYALFKNSDSSPNSILRVVLYSNLMVFRNGAVRILYPFRTNLYRKRDI